MPESPEGFRPAPVSYKRRRWPWIILLLVVGLMIYLLISGEILQNIFNP